MPSDPMTAEALHALVSQWPQEARDKDLVFNPANKYGESLGWECEGEFIIDRHAIALHEASGLRWLLHEWCCSVRIFPPEMDDGTAYVIVIGGNTNDNHHVSPTLIEAISAAIMATAKEQA